VVAAPREKPTNESDESATRPETTNKPVVKTGDGDVTRPDEPVLFAATCEKPTNEGDAGDESSASSEPLSLSADDDLPSGDESQGVKSVSGNSTTTETSEDEAKNPSYQEAPRLANIISQSQTTVPPAVPGDPPSPVRSKIKEIKYWSSNLEKPYFLHKTDRFEFPHYQFPAHPGHTQHFKPTDRMRKQYDEYFANLSTNPLPEDQIVTMIGKTSVKVKSLNSLKPGEWLKDTILTAYLNLLGNEVYALNKEDKNPTKMAVFDSLFLNNLVDSTDEYNYKNARGSARKRLRGRCPSDFEVLFFFATKNIFTISIWLCAPDYGQSVCSIRLVGTHSRMPRISFAGCMMRCISIGSSRRKNCSWPTNHAWDGLIASTQIVGSKWMAMSAAFGLLQMERAWC
jgi:hypothetical protein